MGGQGIAATVPQQSQTTGMIPCTMRDSAMGGRNIALFRWLATHVLRPIGKKKIEHKLSIRRLQRTR
jgi:hypothetical protein